MSRPFVPGPQEQRAQKGSVVCVMFLNSLKTYRSIIYEGSRGCCANYKQAIVEYVRSCIYTFVHDHSNIAV